MDAIDAMERLLCQRYNVQALGPGELSTALALARGGNLQPLREALDARELYRWGPEIYAGLATAESEPSEHGEAEDSDGESLHDLTVAQLRSLAEERGIDLGDARLKADIIAAIESGDDPDEDVSPVEPTT